MLGFLCALIAGADMSIQGVMNTRLGNKVGVLETNALVQGVGFALALAIAFLFGRGNIRLIGQSPWYTWLGGVIAPIITYGSDLHHPSCTADSGRADRRLWLDGF